MKEKTLLTNSTQLTANFLEGKNDSPNYAGDYAGEFGSDIIAATPQTEG